LKETTNDAQSFVNDARCTPGWFWAGLLASAFGGCFGQGRCKECSFFAEFGGWLDGMNWNGGQEL
jgi:hypothetical protein